MYNLNGFKRKIWIAGDWVTKKISATFGTTKYGHPLAESSDEAHASRFTSEECLLLYSSLHKNGLNRLVHVVQESS